MRAGLAQELGGELRVIDSYSSCASLAGVITHKINL